MNNKTVSHYPAIRFPEFVELWQSKQLRELLKVSGVRNHNNQYSRNEVLSVTREFGIINQIEHLGRSYAGADLSNYHVVNVGDIVYTKSPLKNTPYGIIKTNKMKNGIVSTLYAVYKAKSGFDPNFIDRYFELDDRTNKYLRPLVHKGAKNDMKISNERVLIDPIIVPSLPEQTKLVSFFSSIDEWIESLRTQHIEINKFKKVILNKLIFQEIRFKNSQGKNYSDWESKPLGDLFNERNVKNGEKAHQLLSVKIHGGVVLQGDTNKTDSSNSDKSKYKVVKVGDIAYNTMRMWQGASGVSQYEGIVSPAYTVVYPKKGDANFYGYLFKHPRTIFNFYRYSQGLTSDTWNLKFQHFSEVEVTVPSDIEEQKKIASFLSSLDELIQHKEKQIALAEQWKKGLLQQMFV